MGDMLIIVMGKLVGYVYAFTRTSYCGYASFSYGYVLTRTSKVDMFTTAMGMDMLLLNTDMDTPLPERPMVDMLLLTTTMDMPFSTTGSSTMGQDMNTNT